MRPAWNAKPNPKLLAAPGTVYLTVLFCLIPRNVHAVSLRTCMHLLNVSPQTLLCGATKATNLIKVAARQQNNKVIFFRFCFRNKA